MAIFKNRLKPYRHIVLRYCNTIFLCLKGGIFMKIYDWRKFTTFLAIVLFLVLLILTQCTRKKQVPKVQEYEVQSGETLWEIATMYRPKDMSIQEYIYNLKEYNNIGSIIYPNQVLKILVYEEA